eukprot:15445503-Alexandrium_andersonii.AAC.1
MAITTARTTAPPSRTGPVRVQACQPPVGPGARASGASAHLCLFCARVVPFVEGPSPERTTS